MALRQDEARSWAPSGPPAGPSEAAAALADLSLHRPAAGVTAAPAAGVTAAPAAGATAAPATGVTVTPSTSTPAGLGDIPGAAGFSPDGRFWWDGHRWTATEELESTGNRPAGGGARRSPVWLWAGGAVAALVVLALAVAPVLWSTRGSASDESLQMALVQAAEAQQQHLMDHGRFAADDDSLAIYMVRLGGLPDDVAIEVRAADELTYCVAATAADGGRLWLSESGATSTTACG